MLTSTSRNSNSRSNSRVDNGTPGQPRYMAATAASDLRRGVKTLTLKDKIFELHDAVKNLQSKQIKIERKSVHTNKDLATEVFSNTSRLEAVENQASVLKQALGTLADAVSEEIEELQQGLIDKIESKVLRLEARVNEIQGGQAGRETDNAKVHFELQTIKSQLASNYAPPIQQYIDQPVYQGQDFDAKFAAFKQDTKKLFENMRGILQSTNV